MSSIMGLMSHVHAKRYKAESTALTASNDAVHASCGETYPISGSMCKVQYQSTGAIDGTHFFGLMCIGVSRELEDIMQNGLAANIASPLALPPHLHSDT